VGLRGSRANSVFVGRAPELRTLNAAIEDAGRGHGGAYFVTGSAGIGKSRLTAQVGRLASQAGIRVLRGRATAWGPAPYRPLREVLFSALRHELPSEGFELAGHRTALSGLVPDGPSPSGQPATEESPVVLAEALLRLLARLGHRRGCLVVLEDLHDCDPDTLAAIEYVSDNLDGEPVLLVGTARAHACPALTLARQLAQRDVAQVVELEGLDAGDILQLAAGRLDVSPATVPLSLLDWLGRDTAGVPLFVEELLDHFAHAGAPPWRGTWQPIPQALVRSVNSDAARLGPATAAVLYAAAAVGRRFHPAVVGVAAQLTGDELAAGLRAAVAARLVAREGAAPTYVFRHPLLPEALRAGLPPVRRVDLCRRTAQAVEETLVGASGETSRIAVELWLAAGDHARAAAKLYEAGARAMVGGDIAAAVTLFERGLHILPADGRAADDLVGMLGVALIDALALAGRLHRAAELGERLLAQVGPQWWDTIQLRLARGYARACRWEQGLRHARLALDPPESRTGGGGGAAAEAWRGAVLARLVWGSVGHGSADRAQVLATRALRVAAALSLPEVACEALEVLDDCQRSQDPQRAAALCERGLALARGHGLGVWRARFLYRLGGYDADRDGTLGRLAEARMAAQAAGDALTALEASARLALVHTGRGDYREAMLAARQCEDVSGRLRLPAHRLYGLGARICALAHQGRRAEVEALLAEFCRTGGERTDMAPAVWGFGLGICAMLEEDHGRALTELGHASAAVARHPHQLSVSCGLQLLLSTLAGGGGWAEHDAMAAGAPGRLAWNRRFVVLNRAVLHGRDGRTVQAMQAVAEFMDLPVPQPLAHHLGLRLLAQAAVEDRWGTPAPWLRLAAGYFQSHAAPAVAAACQNLLRRAGARVPQRREGSAAIPVQLRHLGVTVREYEVLGLIRGSLGNQEIAHRLFLSPRTVEKHVASLLAKIGAPDRPALIRYCDPLPWPAQ
jgi:DNA-binding CsgD family transcriptional regulator/tetratricopeptide (TPR) repeat protein